MFTVNDVLYRAPGTGTCLSVVTFPVHDLQVVKLLEKEEIKWRLENQGTVLVKIDGYREFNFLDSESDEE